MTATNETLHNILDLYEHHDSVAILNVMSTPETRDELLHCYDEAAELAKRPASQPISPDEAETLVLADQVLGLAGAEIHDMYIPDERRVAAARQIFHITQAS